MLIFYKLNKNNDLQKMKKQNSFSDFLLSLIKTIFYIKLGKAGKYTFLKF